MQKRRCRSCRRVFVPKAQAPGQCFCEDERCQRERRRRWQKNKRRGDADYRENELRARRSWTERHPEYWRDYRREHPGYAERNREQQRDRDRRRRVVDGAPKMLANEDASAVILPLPSGTYDLKRVQPDGSALLANEDVWRVQIAVLPRS
jgi:hypothetical protein